MLKGDCFKRALGCLKLSPACDESLGSFWECLDWLIFAVLVKIFENNQDYNQSFWQNIPETLSTENKNNEKDAQIHKKNWLFGKWDLRLLIFEGVAGKDQM